MLRCLFFAITVILCAVPAFAARTFYIDYLSGSDSYNGTERTHTSGTTGPWKHAPDMNMTNLYVHGWRLTGSGIREDNNHGGIHFNPNNAATEVPTLLLEDSAVENSENSGTHSNSGNAVHNVGIVRRTSVHDTPGGI